MSGCNRFPARAALREQSYTCLARMSREFLPGTHDCASLHLMRPKAVQEYFEQIARKGGHARAKKLTKEQRADSARHAAQARWAKAKKKSQ